VGEYGTARQTTNDNIIGRRTYARTQTHSEYVTLIPSPRNDSHRTKSPTRKIIGPTQDNNGTWRIKTNEELEILIKKKLL